jgi:hypothetical protein
VLRYTLGDDTVDRALWTLQPGFRAGTGLMF